MKTRSMCKAERSPLDRISALPQPVIETILCLLESTKLAAQTSILSREWRYKWTTIPKLELSCHYRSLEFLDACEECEQMSDIPKRKKDIGIRCKLSYNMYQILLQRQGPIHELSIGLPDGNCLDLDQIILHSSRNHPVKKLTLMGCDFEYWYQLPECIFSFHHLTHLDLHYVDIIHHPVSEGFGSLVSLFLRYVGISKKVLLHLLRKCPSLKSLILFVDKLHNKCTVNELFECLPAIEHLTTCPLVAEWCVLALVPQAPPTSLIHLKYLCFEEVDCFDGRGLAFFLFIIKCSPNLQKIKIQYGDLDYYVEKYAIVWEEYSDVWLEHLSELEFRWFSNTEPEMKFVKFILARSPKLKKVSIRCYIYDLEQETKMLKTLLQAPRVSPVVITVNH